MDINKYRHPKELMHRNICMIVGVLAWGALLLSNSIAAICYVAFFTVFFWISEYFLKASMYGNSIHVTKEQYKDIDDITRALAQQLALERTPDVFVLNSHGVTNAVAVRFLSSKFLLLYSSLVDLLWCEKNQNKLRTIIAHELAHHAAGHVGGIQNLVMMPAMMIPFLGTAHIRAREFTADRIAAELVGNQDDVMAALMALASGSRKLQPQMSPQIFISQEQKVPRFCGFLKEIFASHPRMTKRIIALKEFHHSGLYSGNKPAVA